MKEASAPHLLQGLVTLFPWLRKKCYMAFQQIFLGLHISLTYFKESLLINVQYVSCRFG